MLSTIQSTLMGTSPQQVPSVTEIKKERIFSKPIATPSTKKIEDEALNALNHSISDRLPECTLKSGTLKKEEDGRYSFTYFSSIDQKEVVLFEDKKTLFQWLGDKQIADTWEIVDLLDTPKMYYLLQRIGKWGFDCKTKEELYNQLTNDCGCLWKLTSLDREETKYIQEKRGFFGRPYYTEVVFDNLIYIANNLVDLNQEKQPQKEIKNEATPLFSSTNVKLIALGVLGLFGCREFLPAFALASSFAMQRGNGYSLSGYAFPSLFFSLFSQAVAQNSPPFVSNPIGDFSILPGGSFSIPNLKSIFSDSNRDTLQITVSPVPNFINVTQSPFSFLTKINGTNNAADVDVVDDLLHVFGNVNPDYYEIWNIANLFNPQQLSTFSRWNSCNGGLVNGNYAFVAAGPGKVVGISNPSFPTDQGELASNATAVDNFALDPARDILWMSEGTRLIAVNVANPASSELLGSFTNPPSQEIQGIFADSNGLVYIVGGYQGGLRVINGTDPTNLTELGFVTINEVSLEVFVRGNVAYVADRFDGLRLIDVSNPQNPTPISFIDEGNVGVNSVKVSGPYAYITYENMVVLVDIRNSQNPAVYTRIPLQEIPKRATVVENRMYVSTFGDVVVYEINSVSMSGTPGAQNRGEFEVTVTGEDGQGGVAQHTFKIVVFNGNPTVVRPIENQNVEVGQQFALTVNPQDIFFDLEGDPLALTVKGLPSWLIFDPLSNTFTGVPTSSDAGTVTVHLNAADPFNGTVTSPFQIFVSNRGFATRVLAIVIPVVGGVLLISGGTFVFLRYAKRKKGRAAESPVFELSTNERKNITGVFGDQKYAWLQFPREEKENLFLQTGMWLHREDGIIGKGSFGSIQICWSFTDGYVVAKIVEGNERYEASLKEAGLQRKAAGPGVCPIFHTITDDKNKKLIHFMPIAGLNNVDHVRSLILNANLSDKIKIFAAYIGRDVLLGLNTCHANGVFHNDLKGPNVIVNKKGESKITDFGCSTESKNPTIQECDGDLRSFSPLRLAKEAFRGDKNDIWALGCLLLEFITGTPIFILLDIGTIREKIKSDNSLETVKSHFDEKLKGLNFFRDVKEGSILQAIRWMLDTDEKTRPLPTQLLQSPCFSKLNEEKKEALFVKLVEKPPQEIGSLNDQTKGNLSETTVVSVDDQNQDFFYNSSEEQLYYMSSTE